MRGARKHSKEGEKQVDFIAIDFETANKNYNSACSLGMVFVKDNEIRDEKYFLIKPPSLYFNPRHIEVHGIRPEDVENERTFAEVWSEIAEHFSGTTIVAHNAYFDMSVLKACLEAYGLEQPSFNYICSIPISNRALRGYKVGQSLKERTAFFNIESFNHHNALEDARACAQLVIKSIETTNRKSLDSFCKAYSTLPVKTFAELKTPAAAAKKRAANARPFAQAIKVSELQPTTDSFDKNHPFFGKNVVFTGEFQQIEKKAAMQTVIDAGGSVKTGVSKKTDYLIVGVQDRRIVGPNGMSSKETKAIDLIHQGAGIEILSEHAFLELLKKVNA